MAIRVGDAAVVHKPQLLHAIDVGLAPFMLDLSKCRRHQQRNVAKLSMACSLVGLHGLVADWLAIRRQAHLHNARAEMQITLREGKLYTAGGKLIV